MLWYKSFNEYNFLITGATVTYSIAYNGSSSGESVVVTVSLLDRDGTLVIKNTGDQGTLAVNNPKLWWPYLMDLDPGYLYTLEVRI